MSVANAGVHNRANTATQHGHSHIAAHASMMAARLLLQHVCDSQQGIAAPAQLHSHYQYLCCAVLVMPQFYYADGRLLMTCCAAAVVGSNPTLPEKQFC